MLRVVMAITTARSRHGDWYVRGDGSGRVADSLMTPPHVERDPVSGVTPGEFGNFSIENRSTLVTL
jgi:hypothetical protein